MLTTLVIKVYALEKILKVSADSGLLITFCHFTLTTAFSYPSQFGGTKLLKTSKVPQYKWMWIAVLHSTVNILNNYAFAYNISVPVHIVLRSFGSVWTMIAGFIRGRRYSKLQVASVALLTVGVLVSAWADSERKVSTVCKFQWSGSLTHIMAGQEHECQIRC